jgi:hypothetical protein
MFQLARYSCPLIYVLDLHLFLVFGYVFAAFDIRLLVFNDAWYNALRALA